MNEGDSGVCMCTCVCVIERECSHGCTGHEQEMESFEESNPHSFYTQCVLMECERKRVEPGNVPESEAVSGGFILQKSHHFQTSQVQDLLHWGYYPCLEGNTQKREFCNQTAHPHKFLYAGVVYLEYGGS